MLKPWVLLLAAVVTSPALYAALVTETLPLDEALQRYLLGVVACALAGAFLRTLVTGLGPSDESDGAPRRRREDAVEGVVQQPGEGA